LEKLGETITRNWLCV